MLINLPTNIFSPSTMLIFFVLLTLILASSVVLMLIYILSGRSVKGQPQSQKGYQVKESALEDALKIVDEARTSAIRVLIESHKKASGIVEEVKSLNHEAKKELSTKLRGVYEGYLNNIKDLGEDVVGVYKNTINAEERQAAGLLKQATTEIKHEVAEQIRGFSENMRKETYESEEKVEDMIKRKYKEVDAEIAEYKAEKIQKLEKEYLEVLADVYANVIGRQVGQIEGEKMILDMIKEKLDKNAL